MVNVDFKNKGLVYFTDSTDIKRATSYANTYILSLDDRNYIIDSSCGQKRYQEIKSYISGCSHYSILCTHYHNDHNGNNGRFARRNSPVIFHEKAKSKINSIRTVSSRQMLVIYRNVQKEDFLRRIGMFNERFIRFVTKREIYSKYIGEFILFLTSYLWMFKGFGKIYTGKKYINYLYDNSKTSFEFNGLKLSGWKIDNSLYAFKTPGHSDCHIVFYLKSSGILVAGDALNFMSPNDVQFGNVRDTIESQKLLLQLVKKENIEILCRGHYPPVVGNDSILSYISEIIQKHEHVYSLTSRFLEKVNSTATFEDIYYNFFIIEDPIINQLRKINFPRSTLVFIDVYLLKMLEEFGIKFMNKKNYKEYNFRLT